MAIPQSHALKVALLLAGKQLHPAHVRMPHLLTDAGVQACATHVGLHARDDLVVDALTVTPLSSPKPFKVALMVLHFLQLPGDEGLSKDLRRFRRQCVSAHWPWTPTQQANLGGVKLAGKATARIPG